MKGTSGLKGIMKGNNLPHEATQKGCMKGNGWHAGGRLRSSSHETASRREYQLLSWCRKASRGGAVGGGTPKSKGKLKGASYL